MGLTLQGGKAGVWSGVVGATGLGLLGAALGVDGDLLVGGVWNVMLSAVVLVEV